MTQESDSAIARILSQRGDAGVTSLYVSKHLAHLNGIPPYQRERIFNPDSIDRYLSGMAERGKALRIGSGENPRYIRIK